MTSSTQPPTTPLRGVNLGGWLVLEKWMTPSLFAGMAATDETSWSVERGREAAPRLRAHREGFIRREDFFWLADVGINAVRIPLGHWIFGPPYPRHPAYGSNPQPFVAGGIEVLDRAMEWAAEAGLRVVLDLHAAPGCQNGFDNGGMLGVCEWHTRDEYLEHSVGVLERLAARYRSSPALYGIQLLNEPRWDLPTALLKDYYLKGYRAIRRHCDPAQVAVIFHDGFRSHREYLGFMQPPEFRNVLFDVHRYQCFERADLDLDMPGHLHKAGVLWRDEADVIQRELGLPGIAGEWSLGLDLRTVSLWAEGPFNHALEHMDSGAAHAALKAYGAAQLQAFERYRGWFFWSYRTETTPAWSFRDCIESGWLPRFQ